MIYPRQASRQNILRCRALYMLELAKDCRRRIRELCEFNMTQGEFSRNGRAGPRLLTFAVLALPFLPVLF